MNLLPPKEKEALRQSLKTRSLALGMFLVAVAFLAGSIMLLPSYFLALGNFYRVSSEDSSLTIHDESQVKALLNLPQEIGDKLGLVASSERLPTTDYISAIVESLPQDVKLDSLSFARGHSREEENGTLVSVSGEASSREALMLFSNALKESGRFLSVDVPVSNLAKDKDLPFSIKIFIKN